MSYRPSDSEIYILFLDRALRKRASSAVADFHNPVRDNARRPVSNLFMQARSRFISATRGIHQAPQSGCTYTCTVSPPQISICSRAVVANRRLSRIPAPGVSAKPLKMAADPSRNVAFGTMDKGRRPAA